MAEDKLHNLFLRKLEQALKECPLKGKALTDRAKTSKQNIHNWASGKTFPGTQNLSDLADALGKPVAWFFTEETLTSQQKVDLSALSAKLREADQLLQQIVRDQS